MQVSRAATQGRSPERAAGLSVGGCPAAFNGQTLRLSREGEVLETLGSVGPGRAFVSVGDRLQWVFPDSAAALNRALALALDTGEASLRLAPAAGASASLGLELIRRHPGEVMARILDLKPFFDRDGDLEDELEAAAAPGAGRQLFVASLAHELRTPLNAIMGFADAIREEVHGPLPGRYIGYAELIRESGEMLLDLIGDVLDMATIDAGRFDLRPEVFDAREAAASVIRLMRGQVERAGVRLSTLGLQRRAEVKADRRAIKQIAINLLSNALKATPSGGRITLILEVRDGNLIIRVEDTGRGISAQDIDRLGQPFEQAGPPELRAAGTGLGLSVVRALAGLHGGGMELRSELGFGTSVSVRLPVVVDEQAEPELDLR